MRERLVGFRHLVHILAALHGVTGVVRSVDNLGSQALGHAALATGARKAHEPAQRQGLAALSADLDWHLVGGAAHAAGLHFEGRHDVRKRQIEHFGRLFAGLFRHHFKGFVAHALGGAALAIIHQLVDQLGYNNGSIYRIRKHFALRNESTSGHGVPSLR